MTSHFNMLSLFLIIPFHVMPAGQDVRFVDVTAKTGISFQHRCGSPEKDWILEVNGSGVAIFDYDNDGDQDIYLVNAGIHDKPSSGAIPQNALYRNDGGWTFTDVTKAAGVADPGWGSGATVADIDNDGFLDLYITNWGPNVLYRNRGDGTFEHLRDSGTEDPLWSSSAVMADFNRDGLVDIYVANYVKFEFDPKKKRGAPECVYKGVPIFCGPGGLVPAPDSLFIALGNGKYRNASMTWGVRKIPAGFGMGSLVVDIQRDGYPDVLVANDTNKNFCFLNMGGKGFAESSLFLGLAYNDYGVGQAGMGLASGNLQGRDRDAIFVTNYEDDTNTLYLAEDGFYIEATFQAKLGSVSYPKMGWGTFFFDADGDADLDLFVSNGHLAPQMDGIRSSMGYRQANQLFLNDGKLRFPAAEGALPETRKTKRSSRGAAYGDLDGDGDPDMVISNMDDQPTILENKAEGSWFKVTLRGTTSNSAAIGARVIIVADGKKQERTLQSGMSYASQCELSAIFGLGASKKVEALRVAWPSGLVESFHPPLNKRDILLKEGEGKTMGR